MRHALIGLLLSTAVLAAAPANAQVRVSIGINVPAYPQLVRIPDYPVYYAPSLDANYFFYDGLYWVFDGDNWYESAWYNGPWSLVDPYSVPVFLLRVPVRYYHVRPAYFRGWAYDAPPRWGEHWGSSWSSRHSGWDRWNRSSAPAPAPLPTYQRAYSGSRYPAASQQQTIASRSYSYVPHETIARQQAQQVQQRRPDSPVSQRAEVVRPAQPQVQQREARRQQQFQQATVRQQAPQRMERTPQAQQQRQERAPQAQAQQAQAQQAQRAERVQQAQVQRQERAQQPPQRAERQQQHENRGQERGEGRERHEGG